MSSSDPGLGVWRFWPGRPSADASTRRAKHRQCTGGDSPPPPLLTPLPHCSKRPMV